jgi:plastocyanin
MDLKWNGLRSLRHAVVVIPFVLLSCIGLDLPIDPVGEKPLSGVVEVDLSVDEYSPDIISIEPGTTVRWVNVGPVLHTVTPERPTQDGVWTRKEMSLANEVFEYKFTVPGEEYQYYCERHPGMSGWVVVADTKAVTDTAPPPCTLAATTCL